MVDIVDIREGAKYAIRDDGKGDEPHFVSILTHDPEVADISDGNTAYQISVISIRAILPDSPDDPLAREFPDYEEGTESGRYASRGPNYILDMTSVSEL